jgi:hypothetical protein
MWICNIMHPIANNESLTSQITLVYNVGQVGERREAVATLLTGNLRSNKPPNKGEITERLMLEQRNNRLPQGTVASATAKTLTLDVPSED